MTGVVNGTSLVAPTVTLEYALSQVLEYNRIRGIIVPQKGALEIRILLDSLFCSFGCVVVVRTISTIVEASVQNR
jgi:hypothetical protein